MSFPQYAREQIENDPARWFEPYEKARAEGEWRAPEALDRVYGRPKQAVDVNTGFDTASLEPGERAELRRILSNNSGSKWTATNRTKPDLQFGGALPPDAEWIAGPLLMRAGVVIVGVVLQAFSIAAYVRGAGEGAPDMHGAGERCPCRRTRRRSRRNLDLVAPLGHGRTRFGLPGFSRSSRSFCLATRMSGAAGEMGCTACSRLSC